MSYSAAIRKCVEEYLRADDWKYRLDEEKEIIRSGLGLRSKMRSVDLVIDLRDDLYIVYFTYPLKASNMQYPEVRDLMNRINHSIMFGCFEMDERDGEIRFRSPVDCEECLPSQEVVRNSILRAAATVSKYGDAMLMTMLGFSSAEDAYNAARDED